MPAINPQECDRGHSRVLCSFLWRQISVRWPGWSGYSSDIAPQGAESLKQPWDDRVILKGDICESVYWRGKDGEFTERAFCMRKLGSDELRLLLKDDPSIGVLLYEVYKPSRALLHNLCANSLAILPFI
jgi:hypothetical protein